VNRSPVRLAFLLIPLALAWFGLSPEARAVCQDACLTNNNTVQGEDALISLTDGDWNTALGYHTLNANTIGDFNTAVGWAALASKPAESRVPCIPNTDTACGPTIVVDTFLHERAVNTCATATPFPTATPIVTRIQKHYQPPPPDTTQLGWRIFEPMTTGPWPAILVIHGGGFSKGSPYPTPGVEGYGIITAAEALQADGYYVLVVDYRLARPGLIPGQPCHDRDPFLDNSGRAPSQELDIEAEVAAIRHNSHCNGKVGVLGGSAGATHAVWASLDTTVRMTWPFWNWNTYTMRPEDDRPDAAVGLSGAYDFADRTPEDYTLTRGVDPVTVFRNVIENYTNTLDPDQQHDLSPVALTELSTFEAMNLKPLFLINSENDNMPFHQIIDMKCALESAGVNDSQFRVLTVRDSDFCHAHAFELWGDVSEEVISFFDSYLK
jgi:acetyl esterase/lipase